MAREADTEHDRAEIHRGGADRLEPRARVHFVSQLQARPHQRVCLAANDERAGAGARGRGSELDIEAGALAGLDRQAARGSTAQSEVAGRNGDGRRRQDNGRLVGKRRNGARR